MAITTMNAVITYCFFISLIPLLDLLKSAKMLPFVLGLKFEIQPAILDALTTSFANPIFQLYALSTDEAKRVKEMFMLYKTTAPQSLHEAGSASCCLS